MRIRVFLCILLILLLATTIPVWATSNNLALNPGFEEGSDSNINHWEIDVWGDDSGARAGMRLDPSQKYTGKTSVLIVNETPADARLKQQIMAKPNTYYKLSCYIKAENVGVENKGANLSIENILDTSTDIKGTSNGWRYVELYAKTGVQQSSFTVTLGIGGYGSPNTGKAWFDEVTVEELNGPPLDRGVANLGQDQSNVSQNKGNPKWLFLSLIFAIIAGFGALFFIRRRKDGENKQPPDKTSGNKKNQAATTEPIRKLALDRKDFIIMAILTLIYLGTALVNLGDLKGPQSFWAASAKGESVTFDFGREVNLSRIYYHCQRNIPFETGKYLFEYLDNQGVYQPLLNISNPESGTFEDFFTWKYVPVSVKTSRIKMTALSPGFGITELGFFEAGGMTPIREVRIVDQQVFSNQTKVQNLLDEQDTIDFTPSFMSGAYFDEIYFARTAYEFLYQLEAYENTHPPLGKILIMLGIMVFGMTPFGWRIVGALFGAAMIPVMYLFGKKLFEKRFFAFCSAFLIMFDFMHFTQTRIATIDGFATFFIIMMYYYMYDYFINKSYVTGFKKSLKPLFLCGICFGLGAATKWVALYGAAGLAILFFTAKINEYSEYKINNRGKKKKPWVRDFIPLYLYGTLALCGLFFIIIPVLIYLGSYIPNMMIAKKGLEEAWDLQKYMYQYHSGLKVTVPFQSLWWEWPLIKKPLLYFKESGLAEGKFSGIFAMGNPAIWWAGLVAFFVAIWIAVKKKDKIILFLVVAILCQYIPWMAVQRCTFIYHYFPVVPFLILVITYLIKQWVDKYPETKYLVYGYLAIVVLLFIWFYPALSGLTVNEGWIDSLKWFNNWDFQ
ncbi:MAG: phospholipid carrier-dependent glycosyltransferase [Firmicutes bacterium]|nr:phospholipid carrier-dependent glycosyltransferase [Bacillota bacterium]